jgi:hypothetical protein
MGHTAQNKFTWYLGITSNQMLSLNESISMDKYAELPAAGLVDTLKNKTHIDFVGYGVQEQVMAYPGQPPQARWTGLRWRMYAPSELVSGEFVHSAEYMRLALIPGGGSGGDQNTLLQNSIVASSTSGGNCSGKVSDGIGNLSYPDNTCPGINGNPVLAALQFNGGPTQTMLPVMGSAAIDRAWEITCGEQPVNFLDQRGFKRPEGPECDIGSVEAPVYPQGTPAAIDIRPGDEPNTIQCRAGNQAISIAILTTPIFDALSVEHTTVMFEGAGETHRDHKSGAALRHEEDVDGDGDLDLVLHFRLDDTYLTCYSRRAALHGFTYAGQQFSGTDLVQMIGGG